MTGVLDNLLPEERLLLSLCGIEFNGQQRSRIRKVIGALTDWDYFVRMANEHGIIALCRHNILQTGNRDLVPEKILEYLNKAWLASIARNTKINEVLKEVEHIADEEHINIILLKGVALEKSIYGNQGLRQMNDIDILVKREDAIGFRRALFKNGFVSQPIISSLHEKILPSYGKHLPEMYKDGFSVEIHFKLFEQKGDSLTLEFIKRSSGNGLKNPAPPDPLMHFLYLIKHLAKHERVASSQLRLYTDLVIILSDHGKEILTPELFDFARSVSLEKVINEKLLLLSEFFGVDYQYKQPSDKKVCIGRFLEFLRHPKENDFFAEQESLLKPLAEMEKISDKVIFIIGYIMPSIKFMMFRYQTNSYIAAILHYPVRWWKLVTLIIRGRL